MKEPLELPPPGARCSQPGPASHRLDESRALRRALARFGRRRDWLVHPDGAELRARVARLLAPVRRHDAATGTSPPRPGGPPPVPRDWLHVAHWNVLHGNRFEAIRHVLSHEPALADLDLLSLNEVDLGLARSGNRDVAFELASLLGMHAAWTALFLELDGGSDTPREIAAQEQGESLFGLALLSRFPLGTARRVELDAPADLLFDTERKVGSLVALIVEVQRPGAPFHAVVTHLDVHRTPWTRREQMRHVLEALPAGPAILCGDLNSTTFARGSWWRSARALGTLAFAPADSLRRRLLHPQWPPGRPREPLFALLQAAGFAVQPFHDGSPSLDLILADVGEFQRLPAFLRRAGVRLLRRAERRAQLRLDWIVARGFEPAPERPPYTLCHLMRGADAASDHAPIGCGLRRSAPT